MKQHTEVSHQEAAQSRKASISLNGEKGSIAVEAALGFMPFALLLFGLLEVISYAHATMSMHYAASRAARWGVLNGSLTDGNGNQLNRVDSIKQKFREVAPLYGLNPDVVTLRICPARTPDCVAESAGGAGRPFIINAQRQNARFIPVFGFLQPRTSVLITNEPRVGQ